METADDAQRKRPPLAKAAGGATGAVRVPLAGAHAGGGARGAKAAATAKAAKPAAFNMTKPASARAIPIVRAGGRPFGSNTSGVAGGAIRVPVFGKKPAVGAMTKATASVKAPFAMTIGAKVAGGKERTASVLKMQPSAGLNTTGMATNKPVETKSNVNLSVGRKKTPTPSPVMKPSAKPAQSSAVSTFGRVKVTPKTAEARAGHSAARSTASSIKQTSTPRFQLKFNSAVDRAEKPSPASTASALKPSAMNAGSSRKPTAATQPKLLSASSNAANMQKKRVFTPLTKVAASPAKKPRTETEPPVPSSKHALDFNIVSPEPQAHHQTSAKKDQGEQASFKDISETRDEPTSSKSVINDPVPSGKPLSTSKSDAKCLAFDSKLLTTSTPGVFITAEEEQLASFTVDARSVEVESEGFLQRVRGLQLFVDNVDQQRSLVCNELLDANALVSECLLDVIADATALRGGVKLIELDELTATTQQQFDEEDPRVAVVAFPW